MNSELTIVIPAYNEAENLSATLSELLDICEQKNWQIILVNDGSSDNSKEVLNKFSSDHLMVIHHKINRGYGGAIKSGIKAAQTKYVVTYDADGQHQPHDIETLYQYALQEDADMVVGSRQEIKKEDIFRTLGKKIIRFFAKLMTGMHIYDLNSGMKLYRADIAKPKLHLCPNSMAYSDIIALLFISEFTKVVEHPITIRPRTNGVSTSSVRTAVETVMEIINIVVLFNPMKVFLPISIFSFLIGFSWGIRCYVVNKTLSTAANTMVVSAILFFLMGLIAEQLSRIRRNQVSTNL